MASCGRACACQRHVTGQSAVDVPVTHLWQPQLRHSKNCRRQTSACHGASSQDGRERAKSLSCGDIENTSQQPVTNIVIERSLQRPSEIVFAPGYHIERQLCCGVISDDGNRFPSSHYPLPLLFLRDSCVQLCTFLWRSIGRLIDPKEIRS